MPSLFKQDRLPRELNIFVVANKNGGAGLRKPTPPIWIYLKSATAAADITATWIEVASTWINDITATRLGVGFFFLARVFFAFTGIFVTGHNITSHYEKTCQRFDGKRLSQAWPANVGFVPSGATL